MDQAQALDFGAFAAMASPPSGSPDKALEVTPDKVHNNTQIETISPKVSVPGAVVLAASGNG